MATAQDRLRQIAILVSSVDAAAARQILLHLPTDRARQVRQLIGQLGPVAAEEKRKILAEFQRSAATAPAPGAGTSRPQMGQPETVHVRQNASAEVEFRQPSDPGSAQVLKATAGDIPHSSNQAWTQLSSAALVRFVSQERPAIAAVVISQLAPSVAVNVLQNLPAIMTSDILRRLASLQDIDPEAMRAIDEHLSRRLGEYQHSMQSDRENSRRIELLLAAAPQALRLQWSHILVDTHSSQATDGSTLGMTGDIRMGPNLLAASSAGTESADSGLGQQQVDAPKDENDVEFGEDSSSLKRPEAEHHPVDLAQILPFPVDRAQAASSERRQSNLHSRDRSLIQIEFEQILDLPPHDLAVLLSETDSELVLLALAGATPAFMRRFSSMLDPSDSRVLQNRLQKIGACHLRDVDEAQRKIVENADEIFRHRRSQYASPRLQKRAA